MLDLEYCVWHNHFIFRLVCYFSWMQANVKELGISSFGVSVTTMEEVFIKAGEEGDSLITDDDKQTLAEQETSSSSFDQYGAADVEYRGGKTGRTQGSYNLLKDEVHVSVVSLFVHSESGWRTCTVKT